MDMSESFVLQGRENLYLIRGLKNEVFFTDDKSEWEKFGGEGMSQSGNYDIRKHH